MTTALTTTKRSAAVRLAALAWIGAAVLFLAFEGVAASGFPGYSYATNYISDLGVPYQSDEGRGFDSQLAVFMNTAFVGQGLLLLLGVLLLVLSSAALSPRAVLLALGALYAVGLLLVAAVHGGPREAEDGTGVLHVAGAGVAIVTGNVLAIVAGRVSRQLGARRRYRVTSVTLGVLGLFCLLMLLVEGGTSAFTILPEGVWERAAVYTILAWELLTGLTLLLAFSRRPGTRPTPV